MKIPIEIERIKATPYKLVKSGERIVGIFKQGKFTSERREIEKCLKEVNHGTDTSDS